MSKARRTFLKRLAGTVAGAAVGLVAGAGGYYLLTRPPAITEQEVETFVKQFIEIQNAHDLAALENFLWNSPRLLLITRGRAIWGREWTMKIFAKRYKGTWKLHPQLDGLQVTKLDDNGGTWEAYLPVDFEIGEENQPVQAMRYLLNLVILGTPKGLKISSILPIQGIYGYEFD